MKNTLVKVLRWLGILPATLLALYASSFIFRITTPGLDIAYDLSKTKGFRGHYLLGPIYLTLQFYTTHAFAAFSGILCAPTHRRVVAACLMSIFCAVMGIGIFIVLFSLFLVKGNPRAVFTPFSEQALRFYLENLAATFGFLSVCIFFINTEDKTIVGKERFSPEG